MVVNENENRCVIPNKDNLDNYVLDTNVLEVLAKDVELIKHCTYFIKKGHCYYITDVQGREIVGVPDRTGDYRNNEAWRRPESADAMLSLIELLDIRSISCIASFRWNFTILDGSMRELENTGMRVKMFESIHNLNKRYISDAQIAEAAIYHDCLLLTNDRRLQKKVTDFFPGRAFSLVDYFNTAN